MIAVQVQVVVVVVVIHVHYQATTTTTTTAHHAPPAVQTPHERNAHPQAMEQITLLPLPFGRLRRHRCRRRADDGAAAPENKI